jgi:2-oxoglutarate dehydrogenase E2 component (dihydrolipoamide succinyltransferase)
MAITVELPALGESVVEGTITKWLVKEGDAVAQDQPLVEVTTDKVDAEIPAPAPGVVEKILVAEGETVAVGAALAMIEVGAKAAARAGARGAGARSEPKANEVHQAAGARGAGARSEPKANEVHQAGGARGAGARSEPKANEVHQARVPTGKEGARSDEARSPRATPVAKRAAADENVDLGAVTGTGVGGRITREDVAQHVARPAAPKPIGAPAPIHRVAAPAAGGAVPPYLTYQVEEGDRVIPMTPLRKIVAEHMVLSKQVSPHVGTVAEIDMSAVVRFRDAHKKAFQAQHGFGLTFLPIVVQATVRALREFPRLNASVLADAIVEKRAIHLGVAVETEKGLVVPVIRDADALSLAGLARAIEDLSARARSKKLSPDELRGGTFTVSNPGRHGNLYGFAIINQPQVGILRMGEMVKRPVVRTIEGEDAIVIRPIMHLALSYDHRAVDGAPANGFLHHVRELLEAGDFEV